MAINKMNDGVGKKIVDALKMQSSEVSDDSEELSSEETDSSNQEEVVEETSEADESGVNEDSSQDEDDGFEDVPKYVEAPDISSDIQMKIQAQLQETPKFQQPEIPIQPSTQAFVDAAFQQSLSQNLKNSEIIASQDDFEYPANVAVLKQLINKLPAGVPKQTGAVIIKQTMEALGISMNSVMQEARQVQESFINNAKECQSSIIEYRKQIGILESKTQQYQRQASVMNDIIGLFARSGR